MGVFEAVLMRSKLVPNTVRSPVSLAVLTAGSIIFALVHGRRPFVNLLGVSMLVILLSWWLAPAGS